MAGNNVRRYFPGDSRPCPSCGEAIVVTDRMAKHNSYSCKKCQSRRAVEWARKNRDKKRAANNKHSAKTSSNRAARTSAWRANHPQKKAAHQAVQTAVRNGSLIKQPCSVCGSELRIHAHHDDYSRPLQVIWFCHSHHMEHHAMLAARKQ
jgi:endogenous inhibitor of DNA gyrase (YacG/DUF329 family)